jgi:hypothetical protein
MSVSHFLSLSLSVSLCHSLSLSVSIYVYFYTYVYMYVSFIFISQYLHIFFIPPLLFQENIVVGCRVTRLGENSPMGRLFTLGSF